jgi:hypothetical protein
MPQKIFSISRVARITFTKYQRSHEKRMKTQAFAIN